ncbi:MAG TPA: glycosyltransferase family 2 protein [Clostridiales bacterium]|nr:glycosyltransferase family 2 protein [Clostridiales bacterium]
MKDICVLMSTFNGEKYLREQIDSILNQKDVKVHLLVRDDGSTDKTIEILAEYQQKSLLRFYIGNNIKPAHSFIELVHKAEDFDFYAFADQDDYWYENKLIRAIECLKEYTTQKKEAIYISALEIVDKNLLHIENSVNQNAKFTIEESFIESPAVGCTMVFNKYMRKRIIDKNTQDIEIAMHDSWIYRVGISIGAKIIYDKKGYIKYRQHENNTIGVKKEKNVINQTKNLFSKRRKYKGKVAQNILNLYNNEIIENNRKALQLITQLDNSSLIYKFKIIFNKKFRSNSKKMNIKFYYDIIRNRI